MSGLIGCMIVLLFSLSLVVPSAMAQGEMSTQTIRGRSVVHQGSRVCHQSHLREARVSLRRHKYETRSHVGPG
jgi:hypothetical protein